MCTHIYTHYLCVCIHTYMYRSNMYVSAHILILVGFLGRGHLVKCGIMITWAQKLLKRQILTNARKLEF